MRLIFSMTFVFVVLSSCVKEVHIDIEQRQPRLVVNALFNTDSLWKIELSQSKYIFDTQGIQLVTDAQVSISDGQGHTISLIHQQDGIYTSATAKPEIGASYGLNVSHNELTDVSATSTLPAGITIDAVTLGREVILNGERSQEILVTFTDNPEPDHYLIQVNAAYWEYEYDDEGKNIIDSSLHAFAVDIDTDHPAVNKSGGKERYTALSFNDELFNGTSFTLDLLIEGYIFTKDPNIHALTVSLSRVSQEYFWYESSYRKYLNTQGNPLAQPVQVYTNINNGLGVFAGYSTTSDSILID